MRVASCSHWCMLLGCGGCRTGLAGTDMYGRRWCGCARAKERMRGRLRGGAGESLRVMRLVHARKHTEGGCEHLWRGGGGERGVLLRGHATRQLSGVLGMRARKARQDSCKLLRDTGCCVRWEWLWLRHLGMCWPATRSWTKHLVVVELGHPAECALAEVV